ncbi:conserved Plasmodium protein, unknown function [Plasmodium berghei]|uniref:Uncharacterized protein n=2 Tax=Plasmodium berghei TaxID=5821 RepID=A0A509AIY8_PLABA|nr:conserved Plasmodium protein, unknown function [Plasmodium berghei ANKA]CXI31974.1 conserved Plasmodium protein, unknown function [Plasmodium berghei]SCM21073.1 conserved Plasmodium protein, unknown function [Plasmodium berghei]SCN24445.1 conserved Plasmodium protein, unknown function [Plasmodium berghei]SCO59634.1 conserved Plasmodium protein, unknown function [Plasmodium berghei]SCO60816.1 conserved Plasmodium protein, unknown function [Plasmodium berghei]|eukprot:XP_034421120.1 conserved Plasmodium protein, unknown function [Plasmodium berghei ANKA]
MGCKQSKAKEPVAARQSTIAQKNTESEEKNDSPFKLKSAKKIALDVKPPPVKAVPKIAPKYAQRKGSSKKFEKTF